MPLYFFHLISPTERGIDDSGCELPNAEQAYLEAYQGALDISFEMLRERHDPASLHFEVTDEAGRLLFDLPFAEALRPGRRVRDNPARDTEPAGRRDRTAVRAPRGRAA